MNRLVEMVATVWRDGCRVAFRRGRRVARRPKFAHVGRGVVRDSICRAGNADGACVLLGGRDALERRAHWAKTPGKAIAAGAHSGIAMSIGALTTCCSSRAARGNAVGSRPAEGPPPAADHNVRPTDVTLMSRLRQFLSLMTVLVLGAPAAASHGEIVSSCGRVFREGDCVRFQDLAQLRDYVLPDTLNWEIPGIYHVTGVPYDSPPVCGDYAYSTHLRDVVVEPCVPDTFGCGRIIHYSEEYECDVWTQLTGGLSFLLGDLGSFAVGDTVVAIGIEDRSSLPIPGTCADYGGFLVRTELMPCPHPVNPVLPTSWGRVKARYR